VPDPRTELLEDAPSDNGPLSANPRVSSSSMKIKAQKSKSLTSFLTLAALRLMPAGLLAGIAAGTAPCCRQAVHTAPPAEAFLHPLPSSPAPPRSYSHPPSLAAGTPLRALSTTRKGARVLMARSIQRARSAAAGCSSALHSLSQRSRGLQNTLQYITSYTASLHPTPAPPRPFAHKAY
jgi:hypothetical protein